jgi:hypothetical protein
MCAFIIKNNIYIFIIMDNSNSLSSSLLQSSEVSGSIASSSGDGSGFFDSLKSINLTTWLIIFLVLAFLGFNIFVYLAKGTQDITNIFAPLIEKIFGTTANVTGQTVDVAAEGAKAVVGGTANVVNTSLSAVQDITPNGAPSSLKTQSIQGTIPQPDTTSNNTLNRALNNSQQSGQGDDYQALEASSSIGGGGQAGWCYVGEDQGYRTCAQVSANDKCMSGDIFPSQELCINPNLRA